MANINNCTTLLDKFADKPVTQTTLSSTALSTSKIHYTVKNPITGEEDSFSYIPPKETIAASESYLIDKSWLLSEGKISIEEYAIASNLVHITSQKFVNMTESEKENICLKGMHKEDLLAPSFMYKLCKEYKLKLFNELMTKGKEDFKSIPVEDSDVPTSIRKVLREEATLTKKYGIE